MATVLPLNDQEKMRSFVDRRHPDYLQLVRHWQFCEETYLGGRQWFMKNIHEYLKEGTREFSDRVSRAYRFNHTREVIQLVTKYIFKEGVFRNVDDAPAPVKTFWKTAMLGGAGIDALMKQVSNQSSVTGRVWIVVDNDGIDGQITLADEKNNKVFRYAYMIKPQDVLDFSRNERGDLNWVLYRLPHREDADPVNSNGLVVPRYMLWTQEEWFLLEEQEETTPESRTLYLQDGTTTYVENGVATTIQRQSEADNRKIVLVDSGVNPLNPVIPVFNHDHIEVDHLYDSPGLVDEIAYLDRAVANYLSNLDAIIQDQTFSQLVIPAQALTPGDDGYNKLVEMGTKRVFTYDGEGGVAPTYISPNAANAKIIVEVIQTIIGEIYHSVGMAGERTKQDNSKGIDNSSGVAKAYDFDRMNALLCAKAERLAQTENKLVELICLWAGQDVPDNDEADLLVKYPDTFDVRGLPDELEIAQNLSILSAPDTIQRTQMSKVSDKLFPRLPEAVKNKIVTELKAWPVDPIEQAQAMAKATMTTAQGDMKDQSVLQTGGAPVGGGPAAKAPSGGNKEGLAGPTSRGKSKQGQAS